MTEFINTADVIGDETLCAQFIEKSITEYKDNAVSNIASYAFVLARTLRIVDIPNAVTIHPQGFATCTALESVDTAKLTLIDTYAFQSTDVLHALILRNPDVVCSLQSTNAFSGSSIASGTGYVYVPRALVDSYKAATNWSTYAAQFRALEDYTVDGTTTGELDETKI